MVLADEVKVGDRVTYHYDNLWSGKGLQVCTVVKITDKRRDIVVKTSKGTQMTFDRLGSIRGGDTYSKSYITKTTDDDFPEIQNIMAIRKCLRLFDEHRKADKITAEMARKINLIFEEADKENKEKTQG